MSGWKWSLFSHHGCMTRKQYWAYWLATVAAYFSLVFFIFFATAGGDAEKGIGVGTGLALVAVSLLVVVVHIQIRTKRLHDCGWSGWLQIPFIILDFFTVILGTVLVGVLPPKTENNKYKPPPPQTTAK